MQLPPDPIVTRPLLFRAVEEPEIVIEAVNATGATDYHWLRPTSIGTRMSLNDLTRLRQQAVADGIPHFELKAGATPLPIPSHPQIAIYRINSDHMQVEPMSCRSTMARLKAPSRCPVNASTSTARA